MKTTIKLTEERTITRLDTVFLSVTNIGGIYESIRVKFNTIFYLLPWLLSIDDISNTKHIDVYQPYNILKTVKLEKKYKF